MQVIDDGDAGFSATEGFLAFAGEGLGDDVHFAAPGAGLEVATWTFIVTPGVYRVSVTWTAHPNRATDAPFTILDGGSALATVLVDQEAAPDEFTDQGAGWEDLGIFVITGSRLVVQLSDLANEYVIADAVRIERIG